MLNRNAKVTCFEWYSVFGDLWGRWLGIWIENSEIQIQGSNIPKQSLLNNSNKQLDQNAKKLLVFDETRYTRVFEVTDDKSEDEFRR